MSKLLSATQAIWNGPFYVGKLEQPVKLGDVVLKVLETVWRGGVLVSVAALVAIGVYTAIDIKKDWDSEKFINHDPALSLDGRLRMAVTYPDSGCDSNKPVGVKITNLSNDRIDWYKWSFAANYEGHSTNLLWGKDGSYFDNDLVISPRGSVEFCHAIPPALDGLGLTGGNGRVTGGNHIVFSPNDVGTRR